MRYELSDIRISRYLYAMRIPLLAAALFVILFYTFAVVVLVPNYPFVARWSPDGFMQVMRPYPGTAAETLLEAGDTILEIDGRSARHSLWRFLFAWNQDTHVYGIQRGDARLEVSLPNEPMDWRQYRLRSTAGFIAVGAWIVAAVVLSVAPLHNRQAWRLGLVSLACAVTLAASEAVLYNVPFAGLLADPLLPFVAIAFADLAMIPCPPGVLNWMRKALRVLYAVALLLGAALLLEILVLHPSGLRLPELGGLPVGDVALLTVGVGLLLNPVILLLAAFVLPPGQPRRNVRILLLFTALAVLPLVLLTILPRVLLGEPLLPWEVGLGLLLLLPMGYGFVVYRHHFLGLDLIVTRALVFLVLTLLLITVYAVTFFSITLQASVAALHPISGVLATCLAVGSVATSGRFVQKQVYSLVFGPSVLYADRIADYAASLAGEPELPMLDRMFKEVMILMEVQRASLWTMGKDGPLSISSLGLPEEGIAVATVDFDMTLQRATYPQHPIFAEHGWLEVVMPLRHEGRTVGAIFMGSRLMDGYFNQLELSFLKQMGAAIAVTIANIALFEASRIMSRQLLLVKEEERVHLATLLHNGPLQRLTLISSALHRLKGSELDTSVRTAISELRDDVMQISTQMRTICTDLHSPAIDLGVELTVREVTEKARRTLAAFVLLEIDVPVDLHVANAGATAVYHILTESLNNIHKHANASSVRISLSQPAHDHLQLTIEDDGSGFVINHASLTELLRSHRFGLVGMHQWARLAQGTLTIRSTPGNGTVIDLTLPVLSQYLPGPYPSLTHIAERIVLCPTSQPS